MAFSESDFRKYHSVVITKTPANGGRMSRNAVSTAKHGLFPRVSKSQRDSGDMIWRKIFLANYNAASEVAAGVLAYIETPSPADDAFLLGLGTQTDTQADAPADLVGIGQLNGALSGGESSLAIAMENADAVFLNGGSIHISNQFKAGQTMGAGVLPGNPVTYNDGAAQWEASAATDIVYPNGLYCGEHASGHLVMTDDSDNEEWLSLAENLVEDEAIGAGDGASVSPVLSDLASIVNGVCGQAGKLAVVTATCGGVSRSVTIQPDGSCTGYCAAGQLNMTDGTWDTDIQWTTAPDNAASITITYRDLCYSYSGSICTVDLEAGQQVGSAYATADTFVGGCIGCGDIEPTLDSFDDSDTSAGTFDEAGNPITVTAQGAEEDAWTLTFSSATAFSVSGVHAGNVGTGSVSADFAPINPETGEPYFTIPSAAWGGTWANGETVSFATHPAAAPLWLQQVIPAGAGEHAANLLLYGYYAD